MTTHSPMEDEKRINRVLAYQAKQLDEIETPDTSGIEDRIAASEKLLSELGYALSPNATRVSSSPRAILRVPLWNDLCAEAEQAISCEVGIEDLFTAEELKGNTLAIRRLNFEYNQIHKLDKFDVAIAVAAGLLAGAVDILLVGIPQKTPDGLKAGPLSNYIRDAFDGKFPPEEMEKLANSKVSKVPFDAQDNRNTTEWVEGLSTYYHRLLSLGHDPLLGFAFGVADILTGRMTTIDKAGKFVSQAMENYADRTEADVFAALAKQVAHLKSDMTTSMGLPAPMMELFNLLQFGSIGEYEQTVAEIVQGMYYEGYDFIHFCSMSVSAMLIEVVVRLGYAIKRIKEGVALKDAIPISTNHKKMPKLGTMLFTAHSAASAINAGKVLFTENPMAINYPQWISFAKYSYQQLKWSFVTKSALRERFVLDAIYSELQSVYEDIDTLFDEVADGHIIMLSASANSL